MGEDHEDHIAGKGINSLSHYNLVHEFILLPEAMKIPGGKAAANREWEKLKQIQAWQLTKVRNKREVTDDARKEGKTVHFCVIDGHLSSRDFGVGTKILKKYKGRIVFRGDIVKDDSGFHAAFAEEGWFVCVTNDG